MATAILSIDLPCYERVEGQRFVWLRRTPWLRSLIAHAASRFTTQTASDASARVDVFEPLQLDDRSTVIPDIAVHAGGAPQLVIEYRVESTERYILGPKRLAYARARVPEMWFVDPRASSVTTFRLGTADDYVWPGTQLAADVAIVPIGLAGVSLRLADLIGETTRAA